MNPETALWLIIDVALAAAIISLFLRYVKTRKKQSQKSPQTPTLNLSTRFEERLVNKTRAVVETFQELVEEAAKILGEELKPSTTMRERVIKLSSKLPREAATAMAELYRIYEPVRFGGVQPGEDDLRVFSERLYEVQKMLSRGESDKR